MAAMPVPCLALTSPHSIACSRAKRSPSPQLTALRPSASRSLLAPTSTSSTSRPRSLCTSSTQRGMESKDACEAMSYTKTATAAALM